MQEERSGQAAGAAGAKAYADLVQAHLRQEALARLAGGSGDRRFSERLVEAARPSATTEESRRKCAALLGTFWDDAQACGARHVLAMIGAALRHEMQRSPGVSAESAVATGENA